MMSLHGKFIVFDGGEGCGKSTQTRLLQHRLERDGYEVLCVRDPGTTGVGELIRGVLLNPVHKMGMRCEMLLYMAARAEMMVETILPRCRRGEFVLSDRFVSSTLAYQLGGDGITAEEIRSVADVAIKGRWPDLTLIFDMPFEHSRKRVQPKFSLFPDDPKAEKDLDRIEQQPAGVSRAGFARTIWA